MRFRREDVLPESAAGAHWRPAGRSLYQYTLQAQNLEELYKASGDFENASEIFLG
jgi:hypothetical protein